MLVVILVLLLPILIVCKFYVFVNKLLMNAEQKNRHNELKEKIEEYINDFIDKIKRLKEEYSVETQEGK
jgi:arginine utilization protein RocB